MLYASGCPWLGDELISFARGTYESDKIILREKKKKLNAPRKRPLTYVGIL